MTYWIKIVLSSILFGFVLSIKAQTTTKSLSNEQWTFHKKNDTQKYKASVPGTIHTDLFQNNLIPDPFYGDNEKSLQWIEKEGFIYETTFVISNDELKSDAITLVCEGLDTYAFVQINGKLVFEANNMFRTWRSDIKSVLVKGSNSIKIEFKSATNFAFNQAKKVSYTLPGEERVFARKAQYQFGWDWGPRFVTAGIYKDIKIEFANKVAIKSVSHEQISITDDVAQLNFKVYIDCYQSGDYLLTINDSVYKVKFQKGKNSQMFPFQILNPKRWWCNGLGDPHLYPFLISITKNAKTIDAKKLKVGLRTIELVQEKDTFGKSFYFKLNGKPVFIKGANYIPPDSFLPRVSDSLYHSIVKDAANANMNMLRVWGGGVYADDAFYNACDENGILVWQDFMFACAMYPGDASFLENVKKEVIDNVIRLQNHPSIALWCGNNENDEGWKNWGWQKQFNYSKADSTKIWNDYQKLFHDLIPKTIQSLVPANENRYWPSSPSIGWGKKESLTQGDSHYWGVWWGKEPFEVYNEKVGRFMSEYGFQSMPEKAAFLTFLKQEDLHFDSNAVKNHQKHPIGYETIREYMVLDYVVPETFEDFIYVSQLLQASGMKTAIEAHRRNMPYCMGTLFWQFNDCWPVTSWSALDYLGNKKAFYYQTQKSFESFLVHVYQNNTAIEIYTINDYPTNKSGKMDMKIFDFQGEKLWQETVLVTANLNSSTIQKKIEESFINQFNAKEIVMQIVFTTDEKVYETLHYFVKPKDLILIKPTIQINQIDKNTIELISDVVALNVYLQEEGITFDTNYFDLLPNQKKRVKTSDYVTNLKIKTLYEIQIK